MDLNETCFGHEKRLEVAQHRDSTKPFVMTVLSLGNLFIMWTNCQTG